MEKLTGETCYFNFIKFHKIIQSPW